MSGMKIIATSKISEPSLRTTTYVILRISDSNSNDKKNMLGLGECIFSPPDFLG